MSSVFSRISNFLKEHEISFLHRTHAPTPTSKDSARERGEDLSQGAKAILYKIQSDYYLFVLAANQKMDPRKIKTYFKESGRKAKKSRFASLDELASLTGLVPGEVPPFGHPILPFQLFVDPSLMNNTTISFNAGSLENSISMKLEDYISVANPEIFEFARD